MALRSFGSTRIIVGTLTRRAMTASPARSTRSSLQPGRRPTGYEGAFGKARKAHRAKYGTGNTSSPGRNTHSSQRPAGPKAGKGGGRGNDKSKRHVKGLTESEGEEDDDASDMESSEDEQATSCQSLRLQTRIFPMRCGEDLPVASADQFAALANPPNDGVARDLSTWAHKVKIG